MAANKVYTGAMAANDLVVLGDTSRSDGNRIRGILWSNYIASLAVEDMDSGSATDGQIPTADGSGGIAWEEVPGGDGSDFDLNDDVTTPIGQGNIAALDRFVISDFSGAGDPNRWADLDDVIQGIWPVLAGRANHTGTPANADIVMIGDANMNDGLRMRRMLWPDFVGVLRVADMDSESATDGHVATADGLGGIDWEAGSGSFDLHDDVTSEISGLNVVDRLVISDESVGGDPNRYVNLSNLMQGMWPALHDHTAFSGTPTNTDIVIMGDASQGSNSRMRRIAWPDFLGNLTVDDMDSGSAANNTVPRADGSGGIDWEAIPSGSGSFDLYEDVTTAVVAADIRSNDRILLADVSTNGEPNRYATVLNLFNGVDADILNSGTATGGQLLTSNGTGGAAWEDPSGAGGSDFDVHDDVTEMIGFGATGSLGLGDHIVVSDESETGDPNRYTNVYSIVQNLRRAALNIELDTGHPINEDYIVFVDTSEDEESSVRALQWDRLVATTAQVEAATEVGVLLSAARIPDLQVEDMDSGTATSGQVATADGSGGIAWGTGVGGSFDLHDNVTNNIGTALHLDDHMLVSDESQGGDPNRYAEVRYVAEKLHDLMLSRGTTTALAEGDLFAVGDISRSTGSRVRGVRFDDLVENMTVADMASGTATDGQVPTADGSGGIDWEDQAGGSGGGTGITYVQNEVITASFGLTEALLSSTWAATSQVGIPLTAIDKTEVDRIELGILVDSLFVMPIIITRAMLDQLTPTNNLIPVSPANSDIIQGIYWSGRITGTADSREPMLMHPTYGFMEARRQANRNSFLIGFDDDTAGDNWIQAYVSANSGHEISIEYMTTYHFEAS